MQEIQDYKDLVVWQKAIILAEDIFNVTSRFPDSQRYVLVPQLQRRALSIPSNIAEGRSRHSTNDFIYHLNIARGSLAELETQMILSCRLGFIEDSTLQKILKAAGEIRRMLFGLRESLAAIRSKPLLAETRNLKPETY